jgi:hypothetical protein
MFILFITPVCLFLTTFGCTRYAENTIRMKQLHIALENENIIHKEKEAVRQALETAVSERKDVIQQLSGNLHVSLRRHVQR